MSSFLPVTGLGSQAATAASTYDLDGTVVSNTVGRFFNFVREECQDCEPDVLAALGDAFSAFMGGTSGPEGDAFARLQTLRAEPPFQRLFSSYAQRNHAGEIFPTTARRIAQAKACLRTIVLITGSFQVFADPVLPALGCDYVEINDDFSARRVRGNTKLRLLLDLFSRHGLCAYEVYTDQFEDSPMLLNLPWEKLHIVLNRYGQPCDPKIGALAQSRGWSFVHRDQDDVTYCAAVNDYADNVIRGYQGPETRVAFYDRWWGDLCAARLVCATSPASLRFMDPREKKELENAMAVAGLYLREAEEVKRVLARRIDINLDRVAFNLYRRLVEVDLSHQAPLDLLRAGLA